MAHGCYIAFLHCEYTLAIKLAKNTVYHKKSNHVRVDCHVITEKVKRLCASNT